MNLHESILELLKTGAGQGKVVSHPGYTPSVLLPEGYILKPLDVADDLPDPAPPGFIKGNVTLDTPEAFGAYVTRFKGPGTIVFWRSPITGDSAWQSGTYNACLDYHEPQNPARVEHGADFTPKFTPEAVAWLLINGKATEQLAFMRFIDEHMPEISDPDGALLYEVARTLEIASHGRFASKISRTSEGRSLIWTEDAAPSAGSGGNVIAVPELLEVQIPVFKGVNTPQTFTGKLLYEVKSGALYITARLLRVHVPILAAAAELHAAVTTALGDVTMIEGEA